MKDIFSFADKIDKLRSDGLGSGAIKTDINNKFGTEFSRNDIEKVFRYLDKPEDDFPAENIGTAETFVDIESVIAEMIKDGTAVPEPAGPRFVGFANRNVTAAILEDLKFRTAVLVSEKYKLFEDGTHPAPPFLELKFLSDLYRVK